MDYPKIKQRIKYNFSYMSKIKLFIIPVIILTIPGFLCVLGFLLVYLIPRALLPHALLINPIGAFLILTWGFWWMGIVASSKITFAFYLFVYPILLLFTIILINRLNIIRSKKVIVLIFCIIGFFAYINQFWIGRDINYWPKKIFREYKPAVKVNSGSEYLHVSKVDFFENIRKNFLGMEELGPADFKYKILGWKNNDNLIYKRGSNIFRYNIITQKRDRFFNSIDNINLKECKISECLKKEIDDGLWISGTITAYPSPDNKKFAIIAVGIYAPEDIVIIFRK